MRRALVAIVVAACARPAPAVVHWDVETPVAPRTTPDEDFRAKPPLARAGVTIAKPSVETRTLKNGIRVWFIEDHTTPMVTVSLISDRGGDQADAGIPEFWRRVAMRASEKTKYTEVNEFFTRWGVDYDIVVEPDATEIQVRVLSKLIDPTLDLVGELIGQPSYPPAVMVSARERLRASRLTAYSSVDGQLAIALGHTLYPLGHRYREPFVPADSIDKVTRDIVTAYHRYAFTPGHITITAAGDSTIAELAPLLEKYFGSLSGPTVGPQAPPPAPPELKPEPRFIVVDKPSGTQAKLAAAWLGPPRTSLEENMPFVLALEALEDAAHEELRVKRGITYGIHIFGGLGRGRLAVGVQSAVEIEHVAEAAAAVVAEVEKLATTPLSDDELAIARSSTIGSRVYFDGSQLASQSLAFFAAYALPFDYAQLRADVANKTSAEAIRKAAEQSLSASKMRIIIVGEASKIVPRLEKLSLGKVETRKPFPL
jgi:zinc protease